MDRDPELPWGRADDTSVLDELDPSQFVFFPSGGSQIGEAILADQVAGYNAVTGLAKVTVTLAP